MVYIVIAFEEFVCLFVLDDAGTGQGSCARLVLLGSTSAE